MILITGASKGIGKFLFEKYLIDEKEVMGLYNTTLPNEHSNNYYQLDITDEKQVESFVIEHSDKLKNIVLINCAGSNYNAMTHKSDMDLWKKVIDTNLLGTYNITRSLLPIMREEKFGRIINFSSIVPQIGTMGTSSYASSKSGLWGLTKVIAKENALAGVTANCLNLGYFNIGMISEVPQKILDVIVESIPCKKLGNPENIYNAIEFLINSDYITGTNIDINGGLF